MNVDQLKAFAAGMINLGNVVVGVTLVTPIFGSGPLTLSSILPLGLTVAVALYWGALDILGSV